MNSIPRSRPLGFNLAITFSSLSTNFLVILLCFCFFFPVRCLPICRRPFSFGVSVFCPVAYPPSSFPAFSTVSSSFPGPQPVFLLMFAALCVFKSFLCLPRYYCRFTILEVFCAPGAVLQEQPQLSLTPDRWACFSPKFSKEKKLGNVSFYERSNFELFSLPQ